MKNLHKYMKTAKKIRKYLAKDIFKQGGYTKEEVKEDLMEARIKISVEYSNGVVDVYDVLENGIAFNSDEGKRTR